MVSDQRNYLFGSEKIDYFFSHWITPPSILTVTSVIAGVFIIALLNGMGHLGWITHTNEFLSFFVVSTGIITLSPVLTGFILGMWQGMSWEMPVSMLILILFTGFLLGTNWLIIAITSFIFATEGMAIASYSFP